MLIEQSAVKLLSLLLVFLSENYLASKHRCDFCGTAPPSFCKSFLIGNKWVCVNCIVRRIQTEPR